MSAASDYGYRVTVSHYIDPDEMNRLSKGGLLEVIEDEAIGPGVYMRIVRLRDGSFWRGRYDVSYLTFEPVERVEKVVSMWRSLNR